MCGDRHHRARAVTHQHEIGDPDGEGFVGKRMSRLQPGVHPQFFHGRHLGFRDGASADLLAKRLQVRVFGGRRLNEGVLRRQRKVGRTHQGIGSCGIDLDVFVSKGKLNRGTL